VHKTTVYFGPAGPSIAILTARADIHTCTHRATCDRSEKEALVLTQAPTWERATVGEHAAHFKVDHCF